MKITGLLKRGPWIVAGVILLFGAGALATTQDAKAPASTEVSKTSGESELLVIAQKTDQAQAPGEQKQSPQAEKKEEKKAGEQELAPYLPPAVPEAKEPTPEEKERKLLEQEIFNQVVTLDFKDADLQNVIRVIAAKTGLNIIMAKGQVKGTVTLHLENVKLGAALDSILKTHDLAFILEPSNIVRIVPRKQVRAEVVEVKTIHRSINWVEALELEKTLSPFKSPYGKIKADPVSNSLIIIDTPDRIAEMEKLIVLLDVPEKQVMIEARMVDMTQEASRRLGIQWGVFRKDTDWISPGTTSLITGQPRQEVLRSEPVIGYRPVYDNTGNQVMVPDPNSPGSLTGLQEPYVTGWDQITHDITADQLSTILGEWAGRGSLLQLGQVLHIFGKDYNLELALDALETAKLVTVLANPKVITLNNVEANIEIKSKIPYLEAVQGPSGQFITNEVEFEETGQKIKVTPNITNNGYVRMKVEPEQRILRGYAINGVPLIDERKAVTNVIVQDESTAVIGGLRQHNRSKDTDSIPWLGQIPVLGWLFKGRIYGDDKLELVMFVTPHILKEPQLTEKEQNYYDKIDSSWKLPDYFFDETLKKEIKDEEKPGTE
jgi:type IV pilus assembly protein PilQ